MVEKAFLKIVEEHQGIVYKVCKMYRNSHEDQEDLFQEIVLQLWKSFPNFRKESKVSTWMYRIAINTAIVIIRKNKPELELTEIIPEYAYRGYGDESSVNEERMFEEIRKLNNAEKAIVALYLENYTYKEIARLAGITENNVGVKIIRIKEKLRNILN